MRLIKISLITCLLIYLSLSALLYSNQRSIMYHPQKQVHELSYYNLGSTEEITFTTKDGIKLQAWYRPPDNKQSMVIFLHGNAGNLEHRTDKLKQLAKMGYGFVIPAWRSFGKSEGSPSMAGLYLDAEAAIDFVQTKGYKIEETILIGESLGTGIATEMATRHRFKGLFLITPYISIAKRAKELYPFMFAGYFTKDNFTVLNKIDKINQPLLIIHGTKDNIVPYDHAEKIFAKAVEPKKFITYIDAGHSDYDMVDAFTQMQLFFKAH
jgi:fermentation-respiration switch protein FrsA (DUF1100 family)